MWGLKQFADAVERSVRNVVDAGEQDSEGYIDVRNSLFFRFRDEDARKSSFVDWPHKVPAPEDLATNGFFHAPLPDVPDRVACFACGKVLFNWTAEDDIKTGHSLFSPDCPLVKGSAVQLPAGMAERSDSSLLELMDQLGGRGDESGSDSPETMQKLPDNGEIDGKCVPQALVQGSLFSPDKQASRQLQHSTSIPDDPLSGAKTISDVSGSSDLAFDQTDLAVSKDNSESSVHRQSETATTSDTSNSTSHLEGFSAGHLVKTKQSSRKRKNAKCRREALPAANGILDAAGHQSGMMASSFGATIQSSSKSSATSAILESEASQAIGTLAVGLREHWESVVVRVNSKAASLDRRLEKLQPAIAMLVDGSLLEKSQARVSEITQHVTQLTSRSQTLTDQVRSLEAQVSVHKKVLASASEISDQINTKKGELESLESRIIEKEKYLMNCEQESSTRSAAMQEMISKGESRSLELRNSISKLTEEHLRLQDAVAEKNEMLDSLRSEIHNFNARSEHLVQLDEDVTKRERAVKSSEALLAKREATVAAREEWVSKREAEYRSTQRAVEHAKRSALAVLAGSGMPGEIRHGGSSEDSQSQGADRTPGTPGSNQDLHPSSSSSSSSTTGALSSLVRGMRERMEKDKRKKGRERRSFPESTPFLSAKQI